MNELHLVLANLSAVLVLLSSSLTNVPAVDTPIPLPEVARTIQCESNWNNVTIIDTNGKFSRGIGQFQDETWQLFSKQSGIIGTSTDPVATVKMMNWAFQNNLQTHWTCYRNYINQISRVNRVSQMSQGSRLMRN